MKIIKIKEKDSDALKPIIQELTVAQFGFEATQRQWLKANESLWKHLHELYPRTRKGGWVFNRKNCTLTQTEGGK